MRFLGDVDLFVSRAAAEVVRMYKTDLTMPKGCQVYRDTTASAAPVAMFYHGVYHTVVVASATSNTVAKCVAGISGTLVTNVFAQAGKCRVTAILTGICSELAIRNVLVVQVSNHSRETVAEHDFARRLMFASRTNADLPRGHGPNLLQVHDRTPFVQTAQDIATQANAVRDPNYRIATAEDGIHLFNNTTHEIGREATELFPALDVATDGAHAFYLGTELMKAETAFALGKRYIQGTPLDWGCPLMLNNNAIPNSQRTEYPCLRPIRPKMSGRQTSAAKQIRPRRGASPPCSSPARAPKSGGHQWPARSLPLSPRSCTPGSSCRPSPASG